MIIVKLFGGLGNQMFQYAAGRCAANQHNTTLKLDISALQKKNWADRKYSLGCFNVKENFIDTPYRLQFIDQKSPTLYRLLNFDKQTILKENLYQKEITKIYNNTYLDGQWQSEKYFSNIRDILLQEFSLKHPLSPSAQSVKKTISKSSVSLHIRRTDYLTSKMATVYAQCLSSYYKQAADKMNKIVANPRYFVFTDDVTWAKENLKFLKNLTVVSGKGLNDYEELVLMSICRHNIIANSSFSWWGAWLNTNPDKIVVAPKRWFTKNSYNFENIIPRSWIKISN